MRISPNWITSLNDNEIFVFGSNLSGIHGAGAAKMAMKWGAEYGNGEGLQGSTYALPTVYYHISRTLTIDEIKYYVDRFIEFVKNNTQLIFLVTAIGCDLAGHVVEDIAPLFKDAIDIENIYLPQSFWTVLNS